MWRPAIRGATGPQLASELTRVEGLSLGWQTEIGFARFDGLVSERADCVVVRTPSDPLFYWGNCLILPQPPRDAELPHWLQRFEEEVGRFTPESGHVAIGFDARGPHEPLIQWAAAGFEIYATETLVLKQESTRPMARALDADFHFRALDLSQGPDLQRALELQCATMEAGFEPAGYRRHRERQLQRYAAMQRAGLGAWFGVWQGDELLADCGLFKAGEASTLGRFQHVSTHPAWRRRGLCTGLIAATLRHGFEQMGLQRLVMCADPEDVAIGIYESLGFQRESRTLSAQRRPPRDRAGAGL